MTKKDDEFRVKLGRRHARRERVPKSFINQVIAAKTRAGPAQKKGASKQFRGRGATFGRVSQVVGRTYHRQVIIKSRIIRFRSQSNAARSHLAYIQRDGVSPDGEAGQLYNADENDVSRFDFEKRCRGDRHQFRLIVSPEDGHRLKDMKPYIRDMMAHAERDLGTKLDWVAVDHYDTGYPHTHIVLRGKDDIGKDLVIDRAYMSCGFRERAAEILSMEMGPKTRFEIEQGLRRQVDQHRFTNLDRGLLKAAVQNEVSLADLRGQRQPRLQQMLKVQRLKSLEAMGLAQRNRPDSWRLSRDLEHTLRRMGEKGDIIKTIHRAMRAEDRHHIDAHRFDPSTQTKPITGRLVMTGLQDELSDRSFAILDATDGRTMHVDLGSKIDPGSLPKGALVEIAPNMALPKPSDLTIAKIAQRSGGIYSPLHHRHIDPSASVDYIQAHERRLEALRRRDLVARRQDGSWVIPHDFLESVENVQQQRLKTQPVSMRILSTLTLEQQVTAHGATWLDHQLEGGTATFNTKQGFGGDVHDALMQRAQVLMERSLAKEEQGQVRIATHLVRRLTQAELNAFGADHAKSIGKSYTPAPTSGSIEGIYRGKAKLTSGTFAIVERSKDFTLVPWRDVLERNLNRQVSGLMRNGQVTWTLNRQRGLGLS